MKAPIKYPLVRVEWIDAVANSKWFDKDEMEKWSTDLSDCWCENVGWLIKRTKHYVVVASRSTQLNEAEVQFGNLQKIPRTWMKIHYLRIPK